MGIDLPSEGVEYMYAYFVWIFSSVAVLFVLDVPSNHANSGWRFVTLFSH